MEKVYKIFEKFEELQSIRNKLMKGCGRKIDKKKLKFSNICGESIFICNPCSSKIQDINIGITKLKNNLFNHTNMLYKKGNLRERKIGDTHVGFTNMWMDTESFAVFYEDDLKNIFNGANTKAYLNAIRYWKNKVAKRSK